jgi:electron transfer flavoprotein alpha subunit
MSKVLIVAEHLDGKLNSATARCVTCAKAFDADSIDIVVLSDAPDAVAAQAAKIAGVGKVLAVANAANAHALAQVLAPQVAALAAGYTHVLGPSTTFGKDLMPCVAASSGAVPPAELTATTLVTPAMSAARSTTCALASNTATVTLSGSSSSAQVTHFAVLGLSAPPVCSAITSTRGFTARLAAAARPRARPRSARARLSRAAPAARCCGS